MNMNMDMRSLLRLPVLLALIWENKAQKLTVSLLPKFPQVYIGDDVTLICNRKGGSKPTTWFIDDKKQSHQDYSMFLTAVTPKNNGEYKCEQNGLMSDPLTLTVLELEPHAQLSPSVGGAVMTKGEGRNLVLQAEDDLKNWTCSVLRGVSRFGLGVNVDEQMKRAVIFAELKEAERATFWCQKKNFSRSNTVTLKMTEHVVMLVPPAVPALQGESVDLRCVVWGGSKLEKAVFYKDNTKIINSPEGTYTIVNATQDDNGKYSCHATYRFSHTSAGAALKEGDSDAQELKVIGGPAAAIISGSTKSLQCSCPRCPDNCMSCHWYYTLFNDPHSRRRLPENDQSITAEEEGLYSCRFDCGKGLSRFSDSYSYKAEFGGLLYILLGVAALIILMGVIVWMLKRRKCGGSNVQVTGRGKDNDVLTHFERREDF
ncbi:high affinity immunoglobulin gamma Fc receptor I-like isoform X2 [Cyprinus carpio]|uniref:high affinity immunoglobulin gamma Fc receptor I-like isoform X2 n=1 Tax=Cyprinus carpio TaxID=7962 RepID=UPI001C56EE47|nr:high affinity immunoglobulin gamma Fc receptor I-like isoform X2 [Cyprinus carpio]